MDCLICSSSPFFNVVAFVKLVQLAVHPVLKTLYGPCGTDQVSWVSMPENEFELPFSVNR